MSAKRKFAVGDRAWWCGRRWVEYRVVGTVGRSYLMAEAGEDSSRAEKVSYQLAEREYYSDAECERFRWDGDYRRVLVHLIERADMETLKLVAATLGYEPGKQAEGREGDATAG